MDINNGISCETASLYKMRIELLTLFSDYFNKLYNEFTKKNISSTKFRAHERLYVHGWELCRVDLKNKGKPLNDIRFLENDNVVITSPNWMNKNGSGFKIVSKKNNIKLKFRCINDGELIIKLRSMDFRDITDTSIRSPIYIIYESVKLNGEILLDTENISWHNRPIEYKMHCKNNEVFNLEIKFSTIFNHFPDLSELCSNFNEDNLESSFNRLNNYLNDKINRNSGFPDIYNLLNDKFDDLYKENYNLNCKFSDLNNEFHDLKENNDRIFNSYNFLFNHIFKYYELKPNELMKNFHELIKELLDFIDNVCKKYNLQWWLCSGSVLGAHRHGGFIPWDDDCDIYMLREDYNKFFDAVSNEIKNQNLERNFSILKKKQIRKYTILPFGKLEYKVDERVFGFVDIFPVDYISEVVDDIEVIHKQESANLRKSLVNGENRELALNRSFERLKVSETKTDKLLGGIEGTFVLTDYDVVFPLSTIKLEDRFYPCPNDVKSYLECHYGADYMTIPRVVIAHSVLSYYENMDDINSIFEKHVQNLHKINKNFS